MEFDPVKIFNIRKFIQREICRLDRYHQIPCHLILATKEDYAEIEQTVKEWIAEGLWMEAGKPKGHDMDFWLQAEKIWNFCRHMWVDSVE